MTITFFTLSVGFGLAGCAGFICGYAVCIWAGTWKEPNGDR